MHSVGQANADEVASPCMQADDRPALSKEDLEDEDLAVAAINLLYKRHKRKGDNHTTAEAKRRRLIQLVEVCFVAPGIHTSEKGGQQAC